MTDASTCLAVSLFFIHKEERSMYEAEIFDTKKKTTFVVRRESPYLLQQWLKKHRIGHSKKLVLVRSDV